MANSADPDQLASSEANWSESTLFAKGRVYPGSAGQELMKIQILTFTLYLISKIFIHFYQWKAQHMKDLWGLDTLSREAILSEFLHLFWKESTLKGNNYLLLEATALSKRFCVSSEKGSTLKGNN